MEKKLSIIIPHYNTPKKLLRLLKTIPFLEDTQVIVVDDISTKDTDVFEQIKTEYKDKIEFYTNTVECKGAGGARNVGLDHAVGQWICFLDSDDFILVSFRNIIDPYMESDYDMVYFAPFSVKEGTQLTSERHVPFAVLCLDYCVAPDYDKKYAELHLRKDWIAPPSRIIRRSVIEENNIRFDAIRVCEDLMFSARLARVCKTVYATYETFYIITDDVVSLTKNSDPALSEVWTSQHKCFADFWEENMTFEEKVIFHRLGIKGKIKMKLRDFKRKLKK